MKLLDRYEFTNGRAFETYYLDADDTFNHDAPECDVIGFRTYDEDGGKRVLLMRPDEALIQARMLIDAVRQVTEGYTVSLYESHNGERKEVFRR